MIELAKQLVPKKRECNEARGSNDESGPQEPAFPRANQRRKSEYEKDEPERHDRNPLEAGAVAGGHLGYAVKSVKPEQRAGDGYSERGGAQGTILRGLRCGLHQCLALLGRTSTFIGNTNTGAGPASLCAHIRCSGCAACAVSSRCHIPVWSPQRSFHKVALPHLPAGGVTSSAAVQLRRPPQIFSRTNRVLAPSGGCPRIAKTSPATPAAAA